VPHVERHPKDGKNTFWLFVLCDTTRFRSILNEFLNFPPTKLKREKKVFENWLVYAEKGKFVALTYAKIIKYEKNSQISFWTNYSACSLVSAVTLA